VKGRLDEARVECLRAIDLNPRRIDPRNMLAVMAAEAGDRESDAYRESGWLRLHRRAAWLGESLARSAGSEPPE
jgi:hypothetical protein